MFPVSVNRWQLCECGRHPAATRNVSSDMDSRPAAPPAAGSRGAPAAQAGARARAHRARPPRRPAGGCRRPSARPARRGPPPARTPPRPRPRSTPSRPRRRPRRTRRSPRPCALARSSAGRSGAEAAAGAGAWRGRAGRVRRPAEPVPGLAGIRSGAECAPLVAALRGPGELARRGREGAHVARRGADHQQQLAGLRSSVAGAVQGSSLRRGAHGCGGRAVPESAALVQASADARARTLAGAAAQHNAVTSPARPLAPASSGAAPPAVLSASRPAPVCNPTKSLIGHSVQAVFTAGKECPLHRLSQRTCIKSSQPPRPARNCQEVLPRAEGYVQPLEQARGQHISPAGHWPGPLAKGPTAPGPADPAGGLLQTGYLASRQ
jgi:hypothetical protein